MTSNTKQILTTVGCFLGVLLLGIALLVWPVRREISSVRTDASTLRDQAEALSGRAKQLDELQRELDEARHRVDREFKNVPLRPRIASVMQQLSPVVDGHSIMDWSLRQDMPSSALSDPDVSAMAIPLNAEMQARFDSVFYVLQKAEAIEDLIRIRSIRMNTTNVRSGGRAVDQGDMPLVTAAIVLDAIYDPSEGGLAREEQ